MNGLEHYRAGEQMLEVAEESALVTDAHARAAIASAHFLAAQVAVLAAPDHTFSSDGVTTETVVLGWDEVNA